MNAHKTDATGLPLLDTFNAVDVPGTNSVSYQGNLDPRLDWSVGREGVAYLDWGIQDPDYVHDPAYGGPFSPKKQSPYKAENGSLAWANNPRQNANDYRLIRYSHVLLWLAEIEVETGDLNKARELVNQIRRRAANPDGFVRLANGNPAGNYVVKEYTTP